ncbi:GDSL-type esterase/lipase family protein [Collimonas fungivorans]|uniref:SGNH hydrolase-type esterase domain-containing protein n=1 Tax=Collimonas fungivorans (strain Ter331) TaxID=1005048 RepID=G0AAH0_COLFT|nr:GDSL-type esterase/lipase family protein [Collimonas fungivorans]AEK63184.1 hypothetical protein CFU_3360 [Collimonas fungivorans Ter331]
MTALTIVDLDNAKLDVDHIADIATSPASTATDRKGNTKLTVQGAVDTIKSVNIRGAWATATTYAIKDVVSNLGSWYICVIANTSGPTFTGDAANWRVYQGVMGESLAADAGALLVGFKQAGTGSISQTIDRKLHEVVSILDKGGAADGVTDCYAATVAAASSGFSVRFPFVAGASNIYWFNSLFPTAELNGKRIDVDPGVVLSIPNNNYIFGSTVGADMLNFKHTTRIYCRDLSRYYDASPFFRQPSANKSLWLSDAEYDRSTYLALQGTGFTARQVAWSTGDTFSADTFTASNSDSFTVSGAIGGNIHMGMITIMPGDKISCGMAQTGTPLNYAIVRYQGGYAGVYVSSDIGFTDVKGFTKNVGQTQVVLSASPPGQGSHQSYAGLNGILSIRIDAWNKYSILLNGLVVDSETTPGAIYEAGFGILPTSAGQTTKFQSLHICRGKPPTAGRFIGIKIFGDSKSCPRHDAWPNYMKEALEFTAGLRNTVITNLAVAGTSTPDMLASMQTNGVAGASVVIIEGGTNDVQGGYAMANSLANIGAMLDLCTAAGAIPVVIIPGMWYGQAQAGSGGQASLNYGNAGLLRAAIIRVCIERGGFIVDPLDYEGPVLANYINPALTPNLTNAGDSVVYDNIHPTTMANRLTGMMVARKIMGILYPQNVGSKMFDVPIATFLNNWGGTIAAPNLQISAAYSVNCTGIINALAGAIKTNGTVIATIPANLAPKHQIDVYLVTDITTERVIVSINPNGNITITGATASSYVNLSGLTWQIDNR